MRIIGGNRDYYEVMPNEKSDIPVYLRQRQDLEIPRLRTTGRSWTSEGARIGSVLEWVFDAPQGSFRSSGLPRLWVDVLFFCGVPYACWRLSAFNTPYASESVANLSALPRAALARGQQATLQQDLERESGFWGSKTTFEHERKWRGASPAQEAIVEVHRFYDAPILLFTWDDDWRAVKNPHLQSEFPTLMATLPAFQAYSEIDMFLGSALAAQRDPIPQRTQELIRDAHGFDDTSFKKGADTLARKQK